MANFKLTTPVAFFIFNRPDTTERVFAEIAKAKPPKMLVIADGPRFAKQGEAEMCAQTRSIVDRIDWDCEVLTNFSEVNLGCGERVSSGIDWVFKNVSEAIILEDDCLPSQSFFIYCDQMLNMYRNDKRIFSISGSNFSNEDELYGHYFSRYSLMWGWATWADRWSLYEFEPNDQFRVIFHTWWKNPLVFIYWTLIFRKLHKINTWDYQWILTLWRYGALSCRPSRNLVKNIGFRDDATHTTNVNYHLSLTTFYNKNTFFNSPLTNLLPNRFLEKQDEKKWARLGRSILINLFPFLIKMKAVLREIIKK